MDIFPIVRRDKPEALIKLLGTFDIDQLNQFGQNLLHQAIAYKNLTVAEALIVYGINVNHQDENGQTPLHYSAAYNDVKTSELILRNSGNVHVADRHGNQPLWTAAFNAKGDMTLVTLLMKRGAHPHHKNKYGKSPLDFAHQIHDEALIQLLQREAPDTQ